MYYYCRTPRFNSAFTCAGRTPESDILEMVSEGLRLQALTAIELQRLWEEKHKAKKQNTDTMKKTLSRLKETHSQLCRQINDLYESFVLGEIVKPEYLSTKASAVKHRGMIVAQIAELEATIENIGSNGELQNKYVATFGQYREVKEITSEIMTEVLKEVRIYPGGQVEIVWNLQDELEKLLLDLQGEQRKIN